MDTSQYHQLIELAKSGTLEDIEELREEARERDDVEGIRYVAIFEFLLAYEVDFDQLEPLAFAPADCPWQLESDQEIQSFIEDLFAPIEEFIPDTVQALKDNCHAIYALNTDLGWMLLYSLNDEEDPTFIVGGAPLEPETLEEGLDRIPLLPPALDEIYQVHNGFGKAPNFEVASILPFEMLQTLEDFIEHADDDFIYLPPELEEMDLSNYLVFFYDEEATPYLVALEGSYEHVLIFRPDEPVLDVDLEDEPTIYEHIEEIFEGFLSKDIEL